MDWQTYSALGIVGITAIIFIWRLCCRKKNPSSCGKDCGCSMKRKP